MLHRLDRGRPEREAERGRGEHGRVVVVPRPPSRGRREHRGGAEGLEERVQQHGPGVAAGALPSGDGHRRSLGRCRRGVVAGRCRRLAGPRRRRIVILDGRAAIVVGAGCFEAALLPAGPDALQGPADGAGVHVEAGGDLDAAHALARPPPGRGHLGRGELGPSAPLADQTGGTLQAGPAPQHRHVHRRDPEARADLNPGVAGVGEGHHDEVAHPDVVAVEAGHQVGAPGDEGLPVGDVAFQRVRLGHSRKFTRSSGSHAQP